jgi:hypothetical protein
MCQFTYAHKYGFGWDSKAQRIREVQRSRQTCLDGLGLIVKPFQEHWTLLEHPNADVTVKNRSQASSANCALKQEDRTIQILHPGEWRRTVWDHDGVTDVVIDGNGTEPVLLKLWVPVDTNILTLRHDEHQQYWLQDETSRAIILLSEGVELPERLATKGLFEIPISKTMQIRIILEDVDTFHEGAD